MPTLQAP